MLLIEKRLDAHTIPGQEKASTFPLPHRERINAIEPRQAVLTPLGKGVQNYLCIRVTFKAVAQSQKCISNFFRVIQLSIVYERIYFAMPLQFHWLLSSRRIYHSKPCMEQAAACRHCHSISIRATAVHGMQHSLNDGFIIAQAQDTCDCTHITSLSFQFSVSYADLPFLCMENYYRGIL